MAPRNPPSSDANRRSHTGHSGVGLKNVSQNPRAPQRGQRLRRPRSKTRPDPASTSSGRSSARSARGSSEPYGSLVASLLSAVVDREELDDRFLDTPGARGALGRHEQVARPDAEHLALGLDVGLAGEDQGDLVVRPLERPRVGLAAPESGLERAVGAREGLRIRAAGPEGARWVHQVRPGPLALMDHSDPGRLLLCLAHAEEGTFGPCPLSGPGCTIAEPWRRSPHADRWGAHGAPSSTRSTTRWPSGPSCATPSVASSRSTTSAMPIPS